MKFPTTLPALVVFVLQYQMVFGETELPTPLSETDALAIVREQREVKAAVELERKQRILGVEAEKEAILDKGGHKMILRRVGWQSLERLPALVETSDASTSTETGFSEIVPEGYRHSMISLGSTVYDDAYTEIKWREPGVSGTVPYTIWANLNFKYLRSINSFDYEGVNYSYIGFTGSVDTDAYITHPVTGEQFLPYDLPEWMPTAEDFSSGEPTYLVLLEDTTVVPELLYEQMDALLMHFSENEPELIAAYHRAEALRRAKEQLDETEPQKKEDVVINYWPIQSNSDL